MTEFEKLPSRVKYYLLEYKDRYLSKIKAKYGKVSLRDFTRNELSELWNIAIELDSKNFRVAIVSEEKKCDCFYSGKCRYESVIAESKEVCRYKI